MYRWTAPELIAKFGSEKPGQPNAPNDSQSIFS